MMFFDRYESLCLSVGKSAYGVAEELGFSSSSVSYWRNGRQPSVKTLNKVAKFFDVTVPYLRGWTDDPKCDTATNPRREDFPITECIKVVTKNDTIKNLVNVLSKLNRKGKLPVAVKALNALLEEQD